MKRLFITTALVLAAAGSASAMTSATELTGPTKAEAQSLVPNGDFDNLTAAQVGAINGIIYGDDNNRGGKIRSVLN